MAIGHLLLFSCGVGTFPLTPIAMRVVASLSAGGRVARKLADTFEKALTASIIVWVLGAFVFYGIALYLERQTAPSAASSAASCQGGAGAVPGAVNANARHQS